MSRESKIALVMGLGFIMAFGFILSVTRSDKLNAVTGGVELAVDRTAVTPALRELSVKIPAVHRQVASTQLPIASGSQRGAAGRDEIAVDNYARARRQAIAASGQRNAAPADDRAQQQSASEKYLGIYTVVDGDNLTKIARKVYGSGGAKRYHDIFKANTDKLENPDSLTVGMKLLIPR